MMWWSAVVLSLTSSTDNFVVGFGLGASDAALSLRMNLIVAMANALGALCSSFVGIALGQSAPAAAGILAALIFAFLGYQEFSAHAANESSPLPSLAERGEAWKLALSMTLNNLAGGVAGGLAGAKPASMGLGALVASSLLMWGGHRVGGTLRRRLSAGSSFNPQLFAGGLFVALALKQLWDLIRSAEGA